MYNMAEADIASATGAQAAPDLRRRYVPGTEKPGASHVFEVDDDKKSRPKVWSYPFFFSHLSKKFR